MRKLIHSKNDFTTRDPYIIKHNNKYYHCYTEDTDSISVSCADSIDDIGKVPGKKVYIPEQNREYSKQLWAPELHIIDGKCYIYVACDDGNNHNHRMYVLENNSSDPMQEYVMHGKISDKTDKWAIDGTVMKYRNELYFVWSGWEGDTNICQDIYIAKMKNPYELESDRVKISTPEYEWEKRGSTGEPESPLINEGAYTFEINGDVYMTYSAAGSWCKDYCIAALKLEGDDPLNPEAWVKYKNPIISGNDVVQGAGHCSVVCEDGKNHVFFHAWDKTEENIVWNTVSVWHGLLNVTGNELEIY